VFVGLGTDLLEPQALLKRHVASLRRLSPINAPLGL
jgi:hypothetical protein